jgi:hypothetical protein
VRCCSSALVLLAVGGRVRRWPSPGCVVQAQGGQSCEVDGAGSGQDVGQDAGVSAAAGFSAAPGAVGEVADLAFHDGAMGAVGLLPDGVFLAALACCRAASWGWMLMTRPPRAFVQAARAGHQRQQLGGGGQRPVQLVTL